MAIPIGSKQAVFFDELLMFQGVQQGTLSRLLVESRVFTKRQFLEKVKVVNQEMKRKRK
jgi:hypothetical protein